jgi:hypothetical protein
MIRGLVVSQSAAEPEIHKPGRFKGKLLKGCEDGKAYGMDSRLWLQKSSKILGSNLNLE